MDLEAIKARAEKATQAPWFHDNGTNTVHVEASIGQHGIIVQSPCDVQYPDSLVIASLDCSFIAHARSDVPALIQEVERLQQESTQAKLDRDIVTRSLELTLPEVTTSGGREPSRAKLVMLLEYAKVDAAKLCSELEAAREKIAQGLECEKALIESLKYRDAELSERNQQIVKFATESKHFKSEADTLRRVGEEMAKAGQAVRDWSRCLAMTREQRELLNRDFENWHNALTAWESTKEKL